MCAFTNDIYYEHQINYTNTVETPYNIHPTDRLKYRLYQGQFSFFKSNNYFQIKHWSVTDNVLHFGHSSDGVTARECNSKISVSKYVHSKAPQKCLFST